MERWDLSLTILYHSVSCDTFILCKATGKGRWNPEKDCALDSVKNPDLCAAQGAVQFALRLVFVLFMVFAAYIYTKLWDVYPVRPIRANHLVCEVRRHWHM